MSSILASAVFVPMVLVQMIDGTELTAVGDNYPTLEACMIQAEHDARVMAREIEAIENELEAPVISHVSIVCEEMGAGANPEHVGYLPLEARHASR